jgi:hypothetical protein
MIDRSNLNGFRARADAQDTSAGEEVDGAGIVKERRTQL